MTTTIVEVRTGLFPDVETLRAGLAVLDEAVAVIDLTALETSEDWDGAVAALLAADTVYTV